MYAIASKENLEKEFETLLIKLENRIKVLSEMLTFHNSQNTESKFSEINTMKRQKYLVENAINEMKDIEESSWESQKDKYQQVFKEASKLLV